LKPRHLLKTEVCGASPGINFKVVVYNCTGGALHDHVVNQVSKYKDKHGAQARARDASTLTLINTLKVKASSRQST